MIQNTKRLNLNNNNKNFFFKKKKKKKKTLICLRELRKHKHTKELNLKKVRKYTRLPNNNSQAKLVQKNTYILSLVSHMESTL